MLSSDHYRNMFDHNVRNRNALLKKKMSDVVVCERAFARKREHFKVYSTDLNKPVFYLPSFPTFYLFFYFYANDFRSNNTP